MQNRSCIKFVELSNRRQFTKKWIFYDEAIKETRYDLREALAPFTKLPFRKLILYLHNKSFTKNQ